MGKRNASKDDETYDVANACACMAQYHNVSQTALPMKRKKQIEYADSSSRTYHAVVGARVHVLPALRQALHVGKVAVQRRHELSGGGVPALDQVHLVHRAPAAREHQVGRPVQLQAPNATARGGFQQRSGSRRRVVR